MSGTGIKQLTLVFCQEAESSPDGRLNLKGIGNELYAGQFPARQDRLLLAGTLEWERDVEGECAFTVHLVAPDGKPIFTIEGRTQVDARAANRAPAKSHLIFPMESLVFMRDGEYRVVVEIAGERLAGPSLYLLDTSGAR